MFHFADQSPPCESRPQRHSVCILVFFFFFKDIFKNTRHLRHDRNVCVCVCTSLIKGGVGSLRQDSRHVWSMRTHWMWTLWSLVTWPAWGQDASIHQSIVACFFDCTHLFNDSVRVCMRVICFQLCQWMKYLFKWPMVKVKLWLNSTTYSQRMDKALFFSFFAWREEKLSHRFGFLALKLFFFYH